MITYMKRHEDAVEWAIGELHYSIDAARRRAHAKTLYPQEVRTALRTALEALDVIDANKVRDA